MSRLAARVSMLLMLAAAMPALSGCAQLMGALRRDLDDGDAFADAPPTVGGRWSEKGFLSPDVPDGGGSFGAVGHNERDPASSGTDRGSGSWLSDDAMASNRRDAMRGRDDEIDGEPTPNTDPVMEPQVRRQYKNGLRATRADFIDESQNEGSLWASDGQTNYYFSKNKVRGIGDIITITVEPDLVRDIGVESRRTLTQREREYEMNIAQERIRAKAMGLPSPDGPADGKDKDQVASSAAAPSRSPAAAASPAPEPEIPSAKITDIDVGKSLALKAGDTIMAEIDERFPNGAYRVHAVKKIAYKGGPPRIVRIAAVVKGSDIAEDDTVPSGKLYEYQIAASR